MYRIVKRIVNTITTVTLLVRWEDAASQEIVEREIVLPASHSLREEEVIHEVNDPKNVNQSSNPNFNKGEKS